LPSFRVFIDQFLSKNKDFYNNLTVTRKIVLFSLLGIILVSMLSMLLLEKQERYKTIYDDLTDEDMLAMENVLRKKNIKDYKFVGNRLLAQDGKDVDVRLELSQEGLPSGGVIGWEKFDQTNFAVTDFELDINKRRALEGELSRTITRLKPIKSSRVHIVSPKNRLFEEDKREPSAAIYIKLKRGQTLSKKQVRGIQYLVSRSVEGLSIGNITIVDGEGNILTEDEQDLSAGSLSKSKSEYKRRIEKDYVSKIRTLIGRVVGMDKVMASVTADIDFGQVSYTKEQYDPEQQVLRSSQVTDDAMKGVGLNPTGVPGSKANLPNEDVEVQVNKSSSSQTRSTQTVNYEIGKIISQTVEESGAIKRLSVSVLIDGKYIPGATPKDLPTYEARGKEEMAKLEALIRQSVGFDDKRGDQITLENMRFKEDVFALEERQVAIMEEKKVWRDIVMISSVALSLIIFFIFVVKPYLRWLVYDPDKIKPADAEVEEFKPDFEKTPMKKVEITEEVPFEELSIRDQIMYLAKHEPQKTTEALRMMMSPSSSAK